MKSKQKLLFLFIFVFSFTYSQEMVVSGTVISSEDNYALPGVSVMNQETNKGASTDFDGKYTIKATKGDILEFSSLGFQIVRITVENASTINVSMLTDREALDEIVVVGYGTQKKADLTSAIVTVDAKDIVKTPTGQVMQALQGKVSGLQVISSGSPGDSPTVRLRGVGSFPGTGNSNPLYVVDGMFYDNIDFVNTSDIESFSVLKDASASAIYGVRAANGVILITTKSGKFNKLTEVNYSTYSGFQVAQNVLKMANTEQFVTLAYESGSQPDIDNVLSAMQRYGRSRINPNVPNVNTDWYKEVLRPALIYSHDLNISSGSETASYSLGANYFSQEGILRMKNEYERFNVRASLDIKANKWLTVGGNIIFSNATKYDDEPGAWNQAYFAVPILPVFDPLNTTATPTAYANAKDIGFRGGQNPFTTLDFNDHRSRIKKTIANFYAQIDLIPEKLSFKTTYNHNYISINRRDVALPYDIGNGVNRLESRLAKSTTTVSNQIWDNILTYTNSFGDHNLTVMGGTSFRDESTEGHTGVGFNFPTDSEKTWYLNFTEQDTREASDFGSREYGLSYFGRFTYDFKEKYLLYGTMRADGTRKYQEKWGYFPAVGLGWVLSKEDFFPESTTLNYLKIRAGWGRLGNDSVGASDGANTTQFIVTAINDQETTGSITTSDFAYLSWEYAEEFNFGLTGKLFDSRLSLEADYYIKDTKNAVIPILRPIIGGSVRRNFGIIRNTGLEMSFDWNDQISEDLSYNISTNFATLKNEARNLSGQEYIDGGSAEFRQRTYVGESLFEFYGTEVAGVYQNDAEITADPTAQDEIANGRSIIPGDFKYKDQNDDGVIDGDDRVLLGSYLPSFTYGINLGINYKNFEFTTSMFGQTGNKVLNRKRGEIIFTQGLNSDADFAINRWHGEGTTNSYPSSQGIRKGWNQKLSNFYVEDGSFFRIQNIQIAYNLKSKNLFGLNIPETRIYFTADRPFSFFSYNGFNPDVANGVDTQNYPTPSTYTIGVNIKI